MRKAPDTLDARAVALFLDVDGTLLRIRDNPSEVHADSALVDILEACSVELGGAMSLVSGRSIAEVDRIFAPAVFPVAGAHGAELRIDGGQTVKGEHKPLPAAALQSLEALAARNGGLLVERKHGGASLHYRKAPELKNECRDAVNVLLRELGDEYRLIAGKMVFEIAPAAHNKGAAIQSFLERPPFAGRAPVFLGDDVTDEDGFRVVNKLDGISIRVGDSTDSEAQYELPDVQSVRVWLRHAILGIQESIREGESPP